MGLRKTKVYEILCDKCQNKITGHDMKTKQQAADMANEYGWYISDMADDGFVVLCRTCKEK